MSTSGKPKKKKRNQFPRIVTVTFFTRGSTVAWQTKADKGVDLIDAGASVLAWIGLAVVNVWKEKRAKTGEGGDGLNSLSHTHTRTVSGVR